MSHICSCGKSIDITIIKRITLNGKHPEWAKRAKCLECVANRVNDVDKVAGYMPSESKMRGQIVITDQDTANKFHDASARTGGIVAKGVRFSGKKTGWL